VQAEVNPTWINVTVGLGHWPAKIGGLLANPNGNVQQLGLRNGTVLNVPYGFQDLYHGYADSWRVTPEESLLSACGGREIEQGVAARPFYAADLDPQVAVRTRAVCEAGFMHCGRGYPKWRAPSHLCNIPIERRHPSVVLDRPE
jgi:hypothetical protein